MALSDATTDRTVFVGQGDAAGNFDIQNVPAGTYNLAIWDEQLSYIMRFKPVTVGAGETVDVNDTGDDGRSGVGVSRWFGWLDGTVYKDLNGNGQLRRRRAGARRTPTWTSAGATARSRRRRSPTRTATTSTRPPRAARSDAGSSTSRASRASRRYPGPSSHDEHTGDVTPSCAVDGSSGSGQSLRSHRPGRRPADQPAPARRPPRHGRLGQARLPGRRRRARSSASPTSRRRATSSTPASRRTRTTSRPSRTSRCSSRASARTACPTPTTTSSSTSTSPTTGSSRTRARTRRTAGNTFTQNCNPIRDFAGADITASSTRASGRTASRCRSTGEQTKDGAFDGGYAFADYCPNGYDLAADDGTCEPAARDPVDRSSAGTYITHVVMPKDADRHAALQPGWHRTGRGSASRHGRHPRRRRRLPLPPRPRGGRQRRPRQPLRRRIPPPPCVGDDHVIDQATLIPRSTYFGNADAHAPLCDKQLVVLKNGPERQRRLLPDDQLPDRPERQPTRATPGPETSRSPAASSARSSTTSTSSATRSLRGTASRVRSPASRSASTPESTPCAPATSCIPAGDRPTGQRSTSPTTATTGGCSPR